MKKNVFLILGGIAIVVLIGLFIEFKDKYSGERVDKNTLKELSSYEVATFAGGCFWCTEADYEKLPGVYEAISGYTGGEIEYPTYKQVSSGSTKHREAVEVYYDPEEVSYKELVDYYWRHNDPTDPGGSFVDRGFHYTSAIFVQNEEERSIAEQSKKDLEESGVFSKPIVTEILQKKNFYPAEEYHQDYYKKNPTRYAFYRSNSGRDQFIEDHWETE